jgi:class 3 adenylate cyclase/tetratricopeptide (TPR) repeat protein
VSSAVETRKTVTVLFCDVTGSTELGEHLDPEALRRVMLRYFEEMRAVLERHGGTVEKFIGDAVVGVFGIPVVHEDDALRAVRAGAEMQERLETLNGELESLWRVRLEARIGVNTGEVVADEGVALVAGDAINVAARLQQSGEPGKVLLGESTYRLIAHTVKAAALDPRAMKGKASPVSVWRLEEIAREARMLSARPDAPIVGRERDLEALRASFDHAVADCRCNLVTVVGPAGIGKSRLARELGAAIREQAQIVIGRCLSYGEGITFWPIGEIIRDLADISGDDSPEGARSKIHSLAAPEDSALVAARVATTVGLNDEPMEIPDCFWALRRLFEAIATQGPLVLVVEDIHWAEPTLLDLIEHLGDRATGPIMLLCLARPELYEDRPSWKAPVLLEPLDEPDAQELARRFGGTEHAARIAEVAGGNPLFVEELAAMLVETGDRSTMPPSIGALLAARLDRLEPDERAVVQRAAIASGEFWASGVANLCPPEMQPRVAGLLHGLVRKRLILPAASTALAEDAFRFAHLLLQEAAYVSLPKVVRAELHSRFADWLKRKLGVRAVEYEEILGYHLERSYRLREEVGPVRAEDRAAARRAATLLGMAGQRAFTRADFAATKVLLERAINLLSQDDAMRLELLRQLSTALWWSGDLSRADELLADLLREAGAANDRRHEWLALVERAARRSIAGGDEAVEELRKISHNAIAVFEELRDDSGLAHAWRRAAHAELLKCRFGDAQRASERALEYVESAGDAVEHARGVDTLCTSLLLGPAPVPDAIALCEELVAAAAGRPLLTANVETSLAGLHAMAGSFDEARALLGRAAAMYKEHGVLLALAGLTQVAGPIEMLARDPAAAERHLRRGLEILASTGAEGYQASLLAEALYRQGRYDEAEETARNAEATSGVDNIAAQVACRTVRAKLVGRSGDIRTAEALAREAIAVAGETDALNLQGDAFASLAEVLVLARQGDAAEPAQQAVALYEQKGNAVAASHARDLLSWSRV